MKTTLRKQLLKSVFKEILVYGYFLLYFVEFVMGRYLVKMIN